MGRELKRVALDFVWPLRKVYKGFINPHPYATECPHCKGTGYSPEAKLYADQWYGYAPFKPEDRGSVPFSPDHPKIVNFAKRNGSIECYGGDPEKAVAFESKRLATRWNMQWCHHLSTLDVVALLASGRLMDFTHTWDKEKGWEPKVPAYIPTAEEVNLWSLTGMGHDSCNQWICVKARCEAEGHSSTCSHCGGEGHTWESPEAQKLYDAWETEEPPKGEGYQMWETTSEGSPISPVFETPEDLASYLHISSTGIDVGTTYEQWLKFIKGPGWALSMVMTNGKLMTGVEGY